MADYQKMYSALFNKISDVINELEQIQRQTEEMYIQRGNGKIVLLNSKPKNSEK